MQISSKNEKIAELQTELYKYAHGGNSFCFLMLNNVDTNYAHAQIIHNGKYPVRNIQFDIFKLKPGETTENKDWSKRMKDVSTTNVNVVLPNRPLFLKIFPFPDTSETAVVYEVLISSENGFYLQNIYLVKTQNKWSQAYEIYKVNRWPEDVVKICSWCDPYFPSADKFKQNVPDCLELSKSNKE